MTLIPLDTGLGSMELRDFQVFDQYHPRTERVTENGQEFVLDQKWYRMLLVLVWPFKINQQSL